MYSIIEILLLIYALAGDKQAEMDPWSSGRAREMAAAATS
jgi:hypothetical protein